MLKEQAKLIKRLSMLADFLVLLAAMGLAYLFRGQWGGLKPFQSYLWILGAASIVWCFLISRDGLYASIRRRSLSDIVLSLGKVHLLGGIFLAAIIFLVDPQGFSRGLFLSFLSFSFVLMSLERGLVRFGLGQLRKRGYNFRNILIVGTHTKAQKLCSLFEEHADWGLRVLGFVQISHDRSASERGGDRALGVVQDLISICKAHPVDEVIFCPSKSFVAEAEKYFQDLEELGITTRVVLDFYDLQRSKRELSLFHDEIPILTFHTKSLDSQQLLLKRMLDVFGAIIGLFFAGVLYPLVALAIKVDTSGPVFFSQERVGVNGRPFRCWKFRSMYLDAEERREELMSRNEMRGAIFKINDDPRITRIGRFLRKTSVDELPQFWNVLKGEMSLVGTRPPTPDEVSRYENWHRRRISIKPGITGLWQVSGRNQIVNFDEIVRLDLEYIDNWNLWLDAKILLKTLKVVFTREGSC